MDVSKSYHIPTTDISRTLSNFNRTRLQVASNFMQRYGPGDIPSSENPFNFHLKENVNPSMKAFLSQPSRVLTKYDYYNKNMNDTSLYDTRLPYKDNRIQKNLRALAESRVEQKQDWKKKHIATNKYNPYLPISETNSPTRNLPMLDERIERYTNTRDFNYESDIAAIAWKLHPSRNPEIIRRNQAQKESDDKFFNRTSQPRYDERKMEYMKIDNRANYKLPDKLHKRKFIEKEDKRERFDEDDIKNRIPTEINANFDYMYRNAPEVKNEPRKPSILQGLLSTVIEPFKILQKNTVKLFASPSRKEGESSSIIETSEIEPKINLHERYLYKPDHILVVPKEIPEYYPDDQIEDRAIVHTSADQFGVKRTMMLLSRAVPKIAVIQKMSEDAIFMGDHHRVNDDLLVAELPLSEIPDKFLRSLKKDTTRDIKDFTYDEFETMLGFIDQHPEFIRRVRKHDISPEEWRSISDSFESGVTFVDYEVFQREGNERSEHIAGGKRGRIQPVVYEEEEKYVEIPEQPQKQTHVKKRPVRDYPKKYEKAKNY
jgi:hypothetical protein